MDETHQEAFYRLAMQSAAESMADLAGWMQKPPGMRDMGKAGGIRMGFLRAAAAMQCEAFQVEVNPKHVNEKRTMSDA